MVPRSTDHVDRPSTSAPDRSGDTLSIPELRLPSRISESAVTGRIEGLRQQFRARAIPERAINLILSSWREKTNTNYNSAWKKWDNWCQSRDLCLFSSDVQSDFLAAQFEEGKQYRSLNCYRSALSSAHLPMEGFPVGQHPLVCRLLKGVFNLRPPQPRYVSTWDVAKLLSHIRDWGDSDALSLKSLSRKLTVLLALVLADRSSDLVRLSLQGQRPGTPEGVALQCTGLAKQSRPGRFSPQEAIIAAFEDKSICPVACLRA